ncbi:Ohr family peroxiredoxin [Caballeronia sp. RCC_10]|uniref:Ohr family peroxiredoxin n=1 Tax=Caballeronia sp. RCC_10 TaxID=3239227 RepID=UPI00352598F5
MASLRPPPTSLLDKFHGQDPRELYSTSVTVSGGDAGHGRASGIARSDDGNLNVHLRLPAELGGSGGGTNPEQLFAAGYAACFHGALILLAAREGVTTNGAAVVATISFSRDPMDGLFMLAADICVHLPGVERELARALVRNTERFCPYAKMARQGIVNVVRLASPDEELPDAARIATPGRRAD